MNATLISYQIDTPKLEYKVLKHDILVHWA